MKLSIAKVVGITAILGAIGWVSVFIVTDADSSPDIGRAEYILWPIAIAPGVIALISGVKAIYRPNKGNVTRSIGSSIFILAGIIMSNTERWFASKMDDGAESILMLLLCFVSLFLYVQIARYVLTRAQIGFSSIGDLFSKTFLLIYSIIVVGCASGVFQNYVVQVEDKDSKALITIVNLLATLAVYQVIVRVLGKKSHQSQTSGPKHA